MELVILSELNPDNTHVGWSVSRSLESVLATTCNARFIYPVENKPIHPYLKSQNRIFKSWYKLSSQSILDLDLKNNSKSKVLLIICLTPGFLLSIHSLGALVNQFDLKVAYLLDGYSVDTFDRSVIPLLDHVFTICSETSTNIKKNLGLNSSFLPLGIDVLKYGSKQNDRPIDIFGYGRKDPLVHQYLISVYNRLESDRFYYFTSFTGAHVENVEHHTYLHHRLLSKSKISLCFEASSVPRFQGHSPILYRWFEGWAAGCTLVGRRPFGEGTDVLMNWENSTIEVPDNEEHWSDFFEDLLNDENTLAANMHRNHRECLDRHDWRYRIQQIFEGLNLTPPQALRDQIDQLQNYAHSLHSAG